MLILLITLLVMNLIALSGIFLFPGVIKFLFSSVINSTSFKIDLLGMKLVVATLMLALNSLFLVVGGVALVTI